jgi:uncharacterized protein
MYQRYGKLALILVLLLTGWFGYHLKDITFNYDFESFFPVDDPELDFYREFVAHFENDNDFLLLALRREPSLFDSTFLAKVHQVSLLLENHPLVTSVVSPTTITFPVISSMGYFEVPVLRHASPAGYAADSSRIYRDEALVGSLFAADGRSVALLIRHTPHISKADADALVVSLENSLGKLGIEAYHLAGKAKAQGIYIDMMQGELVFFLGTSLVLVVAFLAFAYRSWSGVILPLLVVLISVIWITGLMAMSGKSLDILMVLLPTIMFVVGMSDVVHIMTRFLEELRNGKEKMEAIILTFREVGLATLLTSLTTAVGFFTLLTASIYPIREFGLYTGIGVFMAFIVAFTLMPAMLMFLKPPAVATDLKNRLYWRNLLSRGFFFSLRHPRLIRGIAIGLTLLSLVGIYQLRIDTYLIEDVPHDHPMKQDFTFFDTHYGGSRPFEMMISTPTGDIYSLPVLQEIEKVETYLRDSLEVGNVASPAGLARMLQRAISGGLPENTRLPQSAEEMAKIRRHLPRVERAMATPWHTPDRQTGRISGRQGDIGSALSLQKNAQLENFIHQHINTQLVEFTLTGTSNLIDKNNQYLAGNMFQGLAIAFAVTALIAGFLFRSGRMILITLVPNILPLMMVAGIMGIAGITLKLSTSIIFTIAFGIAVDDTIHFLSKLKLELAKGKSSLYALKRTYFSTGKAIVVTSLILSGGFLTLVMSSFGGTFYTGLLVSLTLLFAVVIDLTLLPVLLVPKALKAKKSGTAS